MSVAQETLITLATSQTTPPQAQDQLTTSPQWPKKSKSKDGQGIKQSKNVNATDTAQVCWRCGEPGHKKRDCRKPPFCGKCRKEGHVPALCPLSTEPTLPSPLQQQVDKFSNPTNRCIHCGGAHVPGSCPVRYQPKATSSTSNYGSPKQSTRDSNVASGQVRSQVTPQVSPLAQVNTLAQSTRSNSFPPPPYFPIPFPPPPVPPSNASIAPSAQASDLSAAISLMTNAVNQGNANTTKITDALQRIKTTASWRTPKRYMSETPTTRVRKVEGKQQSQLATSNNQYKAPAARPAANHNNDLARSSDIAGEVTLKTTVDGYQLLKMNELIKNAAAWRVRMPKTNRFDTYFDKETTKTTPKVQINSATLQVMGQTAKDCGYTKEEFIEAVEMYEHFGNIDLEDVPTPSPQD